LSGFRPDARPILHELFDNLCALSLTDTDKDIAREMLEEEYRYPNAGRR